MFETQEIKITTRTIEELSEVIIAFSDAGRDFEGSDSCNRYDLEVFHDELTARLYLYRDYDNSKEG